MPIRITSRPVSEDTVSFSLDGVLDAASVDEVREKAVSYINGGRVNVFMDLSAVDFIDSEGQLIFEEIHNFATPLGGGVRIICPDPGIRKTFEITGLDEIISVSEKQEDSMK